MQPFHTFTSLAHPLITGNTAAAQIVDNLPEKKTGRDHTAQLCGLTARSLRFPSSKSHRQLRAHVVVVIVYVNEYVY